MNRTPEELDAYMARLRKELEAVEQMKAEAVAQEQAAAQAQEQAEQPLTQEQTTSQVKQTAQSEAFAQTYQRYISTQQFSEAFALCLENLKGGDKEQAEKRAKQALELMANSGVRRFALNPKVAISYEKITDGLQSKGYEDLRKRDALEAGKAEVKVYDDGEKQNIVCKTRNYRHIVAIILAIVLAGISVGAYPILYDEIHDPNSSRNFFYAYEYNGEIYKGERYSKYGEWLIEAEYGYQNYFGNLSTAAIKNGTPGILCEDGTFFEEKGTSFKDDWISVFDSREDAKRHQHKTVHNSALVGTIVISITSIVILWLYLASSRRNRKRLFKDVGEIIIKANQ